MIDLESSCLVRDLAFEADQGAAEFSIRPFVQRYAVSTALTLCYGVRINSARDGLLGEVIEVGSGISLLRSASENLQDYIPLLRYLPNRKNRLGKDLRKRRDEYVSCLTDMARDRIKRGTNLPCISSAVLKGEYEASDLQPEEVGSVCLSMISGGFETIPAALMMCIACLSTAEGQKMQEAAYQDLTRHFSSVEELWEHSFAEEKAPFIVALIKETLRQFTSTPMIPPRQLLSPVVWDGAVIPVGTMILVNAQAANHDEAHFGHSSTEFSPERWMKTDPETGAWVLRQTVGLDHLSFGAGSRNCVGAGLAHRLLYCALARILSCYRVVSSENSPPVTDAVGFNDTKSAMVAHAKDFRIRLIPRSGVNLETILKQAQERTSDM